MRYITKPVEVEAIEWLGNNEEEVSEFCGGRAHCRPRSSYMVVSTPEGQIFYVVPGNFIVRDIDSNEYYVCRAEQFQDRYKLIEENEDGD